MPITFFLDHELGHAEGALKIFEQICLIYMKVGQIFFGEKVGHGS